MLHAHPEIKFSKETHFVKRYILPEYEKGILKRFEAKKIFNDALNDDLLQEYLPEAISFEEIFDGKDDDELYMACLFNCLFKDEKVRFIGDKDPLNTILLPVIQKAFPRAKVIHIIRDPRAVISSRIKANWSTNKDVIWHSAEYSFTISKAIEDGRKLFGSNYIELRYEELVTSPENVLKDICSFLGLDFNPEMLAFYKASSSELIRSQEMQWKAETLKPLEQKNLEKWKEELSENDAKIIESALSNEMKMLDYDFQTDTILGLSLLKRIQFRVIKFLFKNKFKLSES